jgi:hypothetical protein
MKLALIAIFMLFEHPVGIHSVWPYRRMQMIAAFRRDRRAAVVPILGCALAIFLLLFVDGCSKWTALE